MWKGHVDIFRLFPLFTPLPSIPPRVVDGLAQVWPLPGIWYMVHGTEPKWTVSRALYNSRY